MKTKDKSRGKKMMKENPASRQAEGKNAGADAGNNLGEAPIATPTAENEQQGYTIVKPVNSQVPADYPEAARRKNNQARDQRSNLGRGKAGVVEVE